MVPLKRKILGTMAAYYRSQKPSTRVIVNFYRSVGYATAKKAPARARTSREVEVGRVGSFVALFLASLLLPGFLLINELGTD